MTEATWFYMRGDNRNGPVTLEEMQRLVASGHVLGGDMVWAAGMPQWTTAANVPALAAPSVAAAGSAAAPSALVAPDRAAAPSAFGTPGLAPSAAGSSIGYYSYHGQSEGI